MTRERRTNELDGGLQGLAGDLRRDNGDLRTWVAGRECEQRGQRGAR
jgi:hypothetical protein